MIDAVMLLVLHRSQASDQLYTALEQSLDKTRSVLRLTLSYTTTRPNHNNSVRVATT